MVCSIMIRTNSVKLRTPDRKANDGRVLFGDSSTSALLSLAAQEGLLEQGRGDSDLMFDRYRSAEIPSWFRRQISQQLILFPEVISVTENYQIFLRRASGRGPFPVQLIEKF
jgi:hypothetical protein